MEDVTVIFKWCGMQSIGKALVDLNKHEFCITESYFQNLHKNVRWPIRNFAQCIHNSSVMLGKYLQQTISADDIFRCILSCRSKGLVYYLTFSCCSRQLSFALSSVYLLFGDLLWWPTSGILQRIWTTSDCSFIRVHSVCFHGQTSLEYI